MHAGLALLGAPIPLAAMDEWMAQYDTDGDGFINPTEFYKVYSDAKWARMRKRMLAVSAATAVAILAAALVTRATRRA